MDVRQRLGRPLKVAVLCSHRAPGLVALLNQDRRRGCDYEIVCCLTSSDTFIEEVRVERRGVRCVPHAIRHFCRSRGVELGNLEARAAFDQATVDLLKPFNPDIIMLDGYLLLLTEPMLKAYHGRILNLHHSDLLLRRPLDGPRYPGLRAVRDAFAAGEPETRATAHVVTERIDDGPVLLRSWSFPVPPVVRWARERGATDVLKAAAWVHQEWMLRDAWPVMLRRTIELAGRAFEDPRTPLAVERLARWELAPDGALSRLHDVRGEPVQPSRTAHEEPIRAPQVARDGQARSPQVTSTTARRPSPAARG
jgi:folate-dependent phosphoribosylglycinamide formyltransferase PurN